MRRSTPTRLELHRARYLRDGNTGLLLDMSTLDEAERHIFSDYFLSQLRQHRGIDYYDVYRAALSEWGIMCPHPNEKLKGRLCTLCDSLLIRANDTRRIGVPPRAHVV